MEPNNDPAQMKIDEDSWVIQIKESLDALQEEEEENVKGFCVSVFNVPKELLADRPEAYIPQMVSIGPSHHYCSSEILGRLFVSPFSPNIEWKALNNQPRRTLRESFNKI